MLQFLSSLFKNKNKRRTTFNDVPSFDHVLPTDIWLMIMHDYPEVILSLSTCCKYLHHLSGILYFLNFETVINFILEDRLCKVYAGSLTTIPQPFTTWKSFWMTKKKMSWHSMMKHTTIRNMRDSRLALRNDRTMVKGMICGDFLSSRVLHYFLFLIVFI